ncbi:SubName: Full=Uncharacterized protein {ECO:0000313/EMBL:CCA76406.1} [Serendipita indica DSM 11827]|uniref:HTH CENPB-type domain-containing protein n=1 Tax=Serendipita indica (strain DSM 11827) TaxID=1109443 RepID=G4TYL3_SERID|nr:SubName: Full=Uncharacterized protein {ECO:0000313/EMBL:CCA76406.1} [Serendipita indica DSM 11827]CCA76406.1 hypothetical protein PIIN_10399 [Serendipita indica DSM 11827]
MAPKSQTCPTLSRHEESRLKARRLEAAMAFMKQCRANGTLFTIHNVALRYGVSRTTLQHRWNGRKTRQEANEERQLLNRDEENALVEWIIFWGGKGMPLNAHSVRAIAMAICGQDVWKHWVERFKDRHSQRLKSTWTKAIDHSRAKALNPNIVCDFFLKLIAEVQGSKISASNIYNADEKGIQFGDYGQSKALVGRSQKTTRVIGNTSREMATVIECVCADGSSITPMVIFKGKRLSKYYFAQDTEMGDRCLRRKGVTCDWKKEMGASGKLRR